MSEPAAQSTIEAPAKPRKASGRRGSRGGFPRLGLERRSPEARRLAAAILEVLSGARTPIEAAEAVGVSPPRYYLLEERALGGLVEACERRPRGRALTPQREVEKLSMEVKRHERECARGQALLRGSQRTVGLSAPERSKPPEGKRRPRRSRLARALKAAEALRSAEPAAADGGGGTKCKHARLGNRRKGLVWYCA